MDNITIAWALYVVTLLTKINVIAIIFAAISFFIIFPLTASSFDYDSSAWTRSKARKVLKIDVIIFIISGLIAILIPPKQTMIQMVELLFLP